MRQKKRSAYTDQKRNELLINLIYIGRLLEDTAFERYNLDFIENPKD